MHIRLAEIEPACHRREHRTKTLAIPAGIADRHLAGHFDLSWALGGRTAQATNRQALNGGTGGAFTQTLGLFR